MSWMSEGVIHNFPPSKVIATHPQYHSTARESPFTTTLAIETSVVVTSAKLSVSRFAAAAAVALLVLLGLSVFLRLLLLFHRRVRWRRTTWRRGSDSETHDRSLLRSLNTNARTLKLLH